jgi:hypothetical protein
MANAGVERTFPYLLLTYTINDPIDLTLRIAAPQLERGPSATAYNPTTNAAFFGPRFDHDPADGSSKGLLIEEARTNSIRNSEGGGSTAGEIGDGGVMPTNWVITANANGITSEIIDTGTEDGLAYIDIKYSGTPTSNGSVYPTPESSTQISASSGQTWTFSTYCKLAAGSLSGATVRIYTSERGSGGADLANTAATLTPTTASLASQRSSVTRTFNNGSTNFALGFPEIAYTSGNAIDLTLRIAAPQLEQGAFATSYIPTTTAAVTRSADSAVVTPISSFYNQAEGTLFAEGLPNLGITVTSACLAGIGNSASEYIGVFRVTSGGTARGWAFISPSLVADLNGGSFASNGKLCLAAKADDFAFSFNGGSVATDTSGAMPSADRLRIGTRPDTGANLNGHIRKVAYWPKRLTNALLEQITT